MDTVRFGRILGHGARQAAKTLVSAVDAATAPNPNLAATPKPQPSSSTQAVAARIAAPANPKPTPQPQATVLPPASSRRPPSAAATPRGVAEGTRRFGRAVWAPAVRLSGVLWLELTGVFFGLFALIAGIAVWRLHAALYAAPTSPAAPASLAAAASGGVSASDDRTRLFFAAGMVVVFGYFSLSSFLKANRRSRRP